MSRVSRFGLLATALSTTVVGSAMAQPAEPVPTPQPAPVAPAAPTAEPTEEDPSSDVVRDAPERNVVDPLDQALEVHVDGLTMKQAASRARGSSPSLRAKLAEVEAAEAKVRQTTIAFFPRVTLKASYTRLSPVDSSIGDGALLASQNEGPVRTGPCPDGSAGCVVDAGGVPVVGVGLSFPSIEDNFALSATLNIPLSDYVLRLPDAADAANAAKASTLASIEAEHANIEHDSGITYLGWVRSLGQVAIATKSRERVDARVTEAKAAYEVGRISRADLMRVETLASNTERLQSDAAAFQALAERQLALTLGDPPAKRYRLGENPLASPSAVSESDEQLVSLALTRRPELRALDQRIRALGASAGAVRGGLYPRLDGIADLTYANPNQRFFPATQDWNATWMLGLAASWTINDTFASSAASDELEATARQLRAQRELLERGISLQVHAALVEVHRAERALLTSERALESATEAHRVAVELYRVGRATTTTIIDAEAELLAARLASFNAHLDAKVARVKLTNAVGGSAKRLAP